MATIVQPKTRSSVNIHSSQRTLSGIVTEEGGSPAVGREIIALGLNQYGTRTIIATTLTDGSGQYSITVSAGSNDRFILIAVGKLANAEYTKALGDMIGAI